MDMYRAFLAIILSFLILFGYQYFFSPSRPANPSDQIEQQNTETSSPSSPAAPVEQPAVPVAVPVQMPRIPVDATARDIVVDTPLYRAVIFEQGGGMKSFVLKKYRTELAHDSEAMDLVKTQNPVAFPLFFTLDNGAVSSLPVFRADKEHLVLSEGKSGKLVMTATLESGLTIVRTLEFSADSYLITNNYSVTNAGSAPQQISPAMVLTNAPYSLTNASGRYLFSGPASWINNKLEQIKVKKLAAGPQILQGQVGWAAYEDSYFISAVIPEQNSADSVTLSADGDIVRTVVGYRVLSLAAGESKTFQYKVYFGPKKLSILRSTGYELSKAVNFGWFDVLAKPMLFLLNFFYSFIGNYGLAIILLTCLIKGAFWPITQKGMKSMKNMQKLQPKVAKLKEKYKDDSTRMNQEMMAMYKTYKVNPVGGCLPMIIQIPFFFALYRVLMAAIELRHAPFMLWINDLSAPDRLMIGVDIPVLHGIPVLTLLMGASMYLQQKMTPTTADPTQAKIMQFLPVIFTFMFINFASGLVLYWLVNNLLSILQQQLINRQTSKA